MQFKVGKLTSCQQEFEIKTCHSTVSIFWGICDSPSFSKIFLADFSQFLKTVQAEHWHITTPHTTTSLGQAECYMWYAGSTRRTHCRIPGKVMEEWCGVFNGQEVRDIVWHMGCSHIRLQPVRGSCGMWQFKVKFHCRVRS